jgi:hypothetical protein
VEQTKRENEGRKKGQEKLNGYISKDIGLGRKDE